MKNIYILLISFVLLLIASESSAQKSTSWSWPDCRNYNGGAPEQPATIYLGDQGTFGHDSWAALDTKTPKWRVVIHTSADINNGLNGVWSNYDQFQHKSNISARFISTGTWYWGMQVEYTDAGSTTAWYCRNNASWYSMYGTPTSDLTVTVSALSDPTSPTATQSSISQINLGWSKWNSKNVMIVRRLTSAAASNAPTQGTAYTVGVGAPQLGTGTVVYNSSGTSYNDTGLTPGTSYTYTFYSENFSYYSPGATASASTVTQTSAATDNFKSKASGNWSTAGNWESSPDNTNWITSTLSPDVSAATIKVLSGHSITLDANVTIPGLTINSGGTFTASDGNARTLTITKSTSGNVTTLLNSGIWNNGTGGSTVVFTGAPNGTDAVHSISGTIGFQNITLNKTGGSANVGASFGTLSSVSSTLEIGTGGFVSTAPPASFYGANAILKFNTGTSYNVGTNDNSWSTTEVPNYITISSGTVNLNAARTATGNLLIDGGALILNAPLTIQGDWTRISGTFTPNSQNVTLSGTTNTTINTVSEAALYDLLISKTGSAYVSLSSNLTVSHNLTISSGYLTIPTTKVLTVSGTLANSVASGLVLESPLNNGVPGSLITNGTVSFTGSGSLKAQRYIYAYTSNANGWHLLSSPVNSPSISSNTNLTPGAGVDDFYAWDEVNNQWLDQKLVGNNITSMVNGNGYLVSYQTAATKYMTGTPNNSAVTFTNLTKTTGKGEGWHLIGNPFPSAIKWNNGSYGYSGIELIAKKMNNFGSYSNIGVNGIIPAMQGFFVQALSGTNTFTIPLNARTSDTASWNKSLENNRILLVANDLETQMMQESDITVNDQSTEGYDYQYDSHFLVLYAPQFYSKAGDELLSTNSLPSLPAESIIPFGFVKNAASSFSIELKESIAEYNVYLKDLKTNTDQNLTETPVYNFTSEATDDPNRFLLHFLSTVGIEYPSCPAALRIYANAGNIYLSGSTGKSEVYVRNMLGQTVMLRSVKSDGLEVINAASLKAGIYVVSVVNSAQTISSKVIIK